MFYYSSLLSESTISFSSQIKFFFLLHSIKKEKKNSRNAFERIFRFEGSSNCFEKEFRGSFSCTVYMYLTCKWNQRSEERKQDQWQTHLFSLETELFQNTQRKIQFYSNCGEKNKNSRNSRQILKLSNLQMRKFFYWQKIMLFRKNKNKI